MKNLLYLTHTLLLHPALRHPLTEIVLSHGCTESFEGRAELDAALAQPTRNFYLRDNTFALTNDIAPLSAVRRGRLYERKFAPVNVSKVRHMLGPRPETYVASRYFAAADGESLRDALTRVATGPYQVVDQQTGSTLATGVPGEQLALPGGDYLLRSGEKELEVTIQAGELNTITLGG